MNDKSTSPSGQSACSGADGPARNADQGEFDCFDRNDLCTLVRYFREKASRHELELAAVARVPAAHTVFGKVIDRVKEEVQKAHSEWQDSIRKMDKIHSQNIKSVRFSAMTGVLDAIEELAENEST